MIGWPAPSWCEPVVDHRQRAAAKIAWQQPPSGTAHWTAAWRYLVKQHAPGSLNLRRSVSDNQTPVRMRRLSESGALTGPCGGAALAGAWDALPMILPRLGISKNSSAV